MKKVFRWLCIICFCIVLAAVLLGIFQLVYLRDAKATLLGCRVSQYANFYCGHGMLAAITELILNLPLGFVVAPIILIRPSSILNDIIVPPSMHPWLKYTNPLVIYLNVLNLILMLAVIHIVGAIGRFVIRLWRHSS